MDRRLCRTTPIGVPSNAVVEGGRVVGAVPFDFDPDPSPLIEAIPDAVHSPTRITAAPLARPIACTCEDTGFLVIANHVRPTCSAPR
jgi:Molybdopterin oxidoreductase N-terminal domain